MAKSGGGSDYDYIFKLVLVGDIGVGKVREKNAKDPMPICYSFCIFCEE